MARKTTGKSGKKAKVGAVALNFDGVETSSRVPDGDYLVKVASASLETANEKGTQYIKWGLQITEGKHAGKNLRHTNSLQPNALFALRNTLEALSYPIPAGAFDLDLEAVTGLEMAIAVENEEYNGKDQSRVVDVFSSDDFEAEEDEDEDEDDEDDEVEETPKKKPKKGKKAPVEEEEDDEDDEDDDEEDSDDEDDEDDDEDDEDEDDEEMEDYTEEELKAMKEAELIEAAEEYDVKPKYKGKGDKKKFNKAGTIKAILEAIEEDDDEDDE